MTTTEGFACLTEAQARVARQVLAEEETRRRHLVVYLGGAHAYGFPSPDSDLDLKSVHIEPTARLLGLSPPPRSADRLEWVDGVEIDYTSNELAVVVGGILSGNGNYIERILGPTALATSPEHKALRPLVERSLSRRCFGHYSGFGRNQLEQVKKSATPTAKKILYVLRTALTGCHLLKTGELIADLTELLAPYGFESAREILEAKTRGERTELDAAAAERWLGEAERALALLEDARDASVLPEEAPNRDELEAWLLDLRRAAWSP